MTCTLDSQCEKVIPLTLSQTTNFRLFQTEIDADNNLKLDEND